jgi:hypothetical protein
MMALKDVKKMCSKFCNGNSSNIVGYTPPTLHKGVRWFVDFTSLDPARGLMRRKRYYIKDSLSVSEKKRRASEIMDVLTKQLAHGWNPWVTDDESRGFVYFDNCLERYLDYVDRMDRKKTRQSYRSRVNILREFITSQVNPIKYAYQFDIGFCNDFIDWIYLDRESSPRTRNNYRGWLYGLAEFLIARKHINTNPVEHIKVMPEHEKYRKDLTPEMLNQMSNYLCRNDKSFFLACLMQYYTLIRPGELSHLKIGDISLKKQTVFVSHEFSKNHKDAEVGLNKIIIKLVLDLEVFKLSDRQQEILDESGYNDLTTNTDNVINCAMLLVLGYIREATTYVQSCGGGSSPGTGWGRDKDEDDEHWWRRCIAQSAAMMRPATHKRKRGR